MLGRSGRAAEAEPLHGRALVILHTALQPARPELGAALINRSPRPMHVWGYEQDPDTKLVEVYIGYLRRKLGDGVIRTVRGVGYVVR